MKGMERHIVEQIKCDGLKLRSYANGEVYHNP